MHGAITKTHESVFWVSDDTLYRLSILTDPYAHE